MYMVLGWGTLCSWRHGVPDPDMFLKVCSDNLWTVAGSNSTEVFLAVMSWSQETSLWLQGLPRNLVLFYINRVYAQASTNSASSRGVPSRFSTTHIHVVWQKKKKPNTFLFVQCELVVSFPPMKFPFPQLKHQSARKRFLLSKPQKNKTHYQIWSYNFLLHTLPTFGTPATNRCRIENDSITLFHITRNETALTNLPLSEQGYFLEVGKAILEARGAYTNRQMEQTNNVRLEWSVCSSKRFEAWEVHESFTRVLAPQTRGWGTNGFFPFVRTSVLQYDKILQKDGVT